jgi:hypothetical protein
MNLSDIGVLLIIHSTRNTTGVPFMWQSQEFSDEHNLVLGLLGLNLREEAIKEAIT